MPSPRHVVADAVPWLLCPAALAAPGTGRTATATGSVVDDSGCLRRCGDVHIAYPFGAGPADNCSVSPELRPHCNNDTAGNGVPKLFVRPGLHVMDTAWRRPFPACHRGSLHGTDGFVVVDIDVIQGRMRVASQIVYSCFINADNTTSEDSSLHYYLPEPYRFSSPRNKFTVLGCLTLTYMLGTAYEDDDYNEGRLYMAGCVADCSLKQATNGSCSATIPGDEGLRHYSATFDNKVNYTDFSNTYPCAYALLMDSSYAFNFSTSYLAPSSNEFDNFRVPVVVDWVIRNKTFRDAPSQPAGGAGYACVSDHSECVDASRRRRGYRCQCAKGFHGNPYVKQGCKDIDECKDNSKYPCYRNCNNKIGTYECVCPEGTHGNASIIGDCIGEPSFPFRVRLAIGISACVLVAEIAFLAIKVLLHKRRMKSQAHFQHNGGQLLKHMLKVEGNASFTVYSRGDILIASRNFHKTKIVGEGAHGTVYKVTLDVGGRATVVAVKRCKAIDESRKKEFVQELVILCHLSHPNIVKLVGCSLEFEAPMLVYEYVQNGNLNQLLHGRPRRHVSLPTWLRIVVESAEALAHLHTQPVHPVLHGDVKPENILLADGWIAKVSDFGCSTIKDNVQVVPKGPLAYLDPEFLHTFMSYWTRT